MFTLGLHALIVHAHLLRKILAINVIGSGVFLILVSLGGRTPGANPDPVLQAMVITGIVVAVSATALALALMLRLWLQLLPLPDALPGQLPGLLLGLLGAAAVLWGGVQALRQTRLKLGLMILADLLLFDALLIVARMGEGTGAGLGFADLERSLAAAPAPGLYVGLFTIVIATGLARPAVWERHPLAAVIVIVLLGLGVAVVSRVVGWRTDAHGGARIADDGLWFERGSGVIRRRLQSRTGAWRQRLEAARLTSTARARVANDWRKFLDSGEHCLQHWSLAITLLVLLVMIKGGLGDIGWAPPTICLHCAGRARESGLGHRLGQRLQLWERASPIWM